MMCGSCGGVEVNVIREDLKKAVADQLLIVLKSFIG